MLWEAEALCMGGKALCVVVYKALCSGSSVLQGNFVKKHRALYGVWGFVGGVSRKIAEALCIVYGGG